MTHIKYILNHSIILFILILKVKPYTKDEHAHFRLGNFS